MIEVSRFRQARCEQICRSLGAETPQPTVSSSGRCPPDQPDLQSTTRCRQNLGKSTRVSSNVIFIVSPRAERRICQREAGAVRR